MPAWRLPFNNMSGLKPELSAFLSCRKLDSFQTIDRVKCMDEWALFACNHSFLPKRTYRLTAARIPERPQVWGWAGNGWLLERRPPTDRQERRWASNHTGYVGFTMIYRYSIQNSSRILFWSTNWITSTDHIRKFVVHLGGLSGSASSVFETRANLSTFDPALFLIANIWTKLTISY